MLTNDKREGSGNGKIEVHNNNAQISFNPRLPVDESPKRNSWRLVETRIFFWWKINILRSKVIRNGKKKSYLLGTIEISTEKYVMGEIL